MKITPQYYEIPHTAVYVEIFEHLIEDMCNCSMLCCVLADHFLISALLEDFSSTRSYTEKVNYQSTTAIINTAIIGASVGVCVTVIMAMVLLFLFIAWRTKKQVGLHHGV